MKVERFIDAPDAAGLTPERVADAQRMNALGWTVAYHPWTGTVSDVPVRQLGNADELAKHGPEGARHLAALFSGSSPMRGHDLITTLSAAEIIAWAMAVGQNVTLSSVAAMRTAGLGPDDATQWYTTVTLASHLRLAKVVESRTYNGRKTSYLKQYPDTRYSQSWATFIARFHKAGRTAQDVLGWGWDTPAWLLDAMDGKPVKVRAPKLRETAFPWLTALASNHDLPDEAHAWLANYICDLDQHRRDWLLERLDGQVAWRDLARALFHYSDVMTPGR